MAKVEEQERVVSSTIETGIGKAWKGPPDNVMFFSISNVIRVLPHSSLSIDIC